MRRQRIRRLLLAASVLTGCLLAGSFLVAMQVSCGGLIDIRLDRGFVHTYIAWPAEPGVRSWDRLTWPPKVFFVRHGLPPVRECLIPSVGVVSDAEVLGVAVPLWIPLALCGLGLYWCRWRDRRDPVRRCAKCGYNLSGNVSGVCPECGTPVPEPNACKDDK
jgi:hypothetical protein